MPATSPSPNSSPTTLAPATSPPPPSNSSITTTTTPPPTSLTRPNQTSHPPPQPVLPPSPQPPATPPPPPTSLPAPPPPATTASPPIVNSPPSPDVSPPPPSAISPPLFSPPPPLRTRSPPPQPPPAIIPSPPHAKTPENSPRPPQPPIPSPSGSPPSPPPSNNSILPGSTLSPPATSASLPSTPTHKPTAKSTPTSNITATKPPNAGGTKQGGAITIGIIVGFFALSLLVLAIWYRRKRKRKGSRLNSGYIMPSPSTSSVLSPKESVCLGTSGSGTKFMYSQDPGGVGKSRSWFTYEELSEATNGFSASNLLGEGGFGSVYKGFLRGGKEVAVKQLKIGGGQGEREFMAEVEIISRVHHRHLVSLVGYCIYQNQRLLVFDYVPNNTLHYHLHGEGRLVVMDWETRVKVAAGAARGIAYLHEDCHPRIIHRDIKSSNILLDNNFDALVADFGLAKLTLDTYTHVTTRVMGTFGYVAPEYASSGKLSEKSDVYSFGVVLLELITGRKPVDSSRPVGQESLVEWARPLLKQALDDQNFEELVDTKLNNEFDKIEMYRMIEAAAACVRHLASKRPRMSQVVRALDSIFELSDLTNGMRPGQSEVFEAREHSAQIRMLQRMAFGDQDYSSEIFSHSQNSWRRL